MNPGEQCSKARRAGFAIIQDVSESDDQKIQTLENYAENGKIPDCFQVVSASHTPGMQTPARSELCAVALLVQSLHVQCVDIPVFIHTDANYVIKVVKMAECEDLDHGAYKRPNNDLVQIVFSKWSSPTYHIQKVKAHESIRPDEKFHEAWAKLGNCVADQVAKAVVARENDQVKKMALDIKNHNKQQVQDLKKVYSYLIAYNRASMLAKKMDSSQNDNQTSITSRDQENAIGFVETENKPDNAKKSAVKILYAWKVAEPTPCPENILDKEIAGCVCWGAKVACEVMAWCRTLRWPSKREQSKDDFGITYLELFVNFLVTTGKQVPVTISKHQGVTVFCDINDTSAVIQSSRAKSATAQAVVLNAIIQQLAAYTQQKLIPVSKMHRVPSLQRLGYSHMRGKTGYKQRPQMMNNDLTLRIIEEFLQQGKDPGLDSLVVSQHHLDHADQIDIPYLEMEQPSPMRVFWNKKVFKKKYKIKNIFA